MSDVTARDWALIILLGMAWGAAFFCNAILLREIGPLTISLARVSLGAAACWAIVLIFGPAPKISRGMALPLTIFGLLHFGLPLAIYPIAQTDLASGVAGIVNAMTPIMVVIVSQFWPGGERATWLRSLGVAAGFFGIALLMLPELRAGENSALWALLVALLGPISYAFALNYVRVLSGMDRTVMTAASMTAASIVLAPLALGTEGLPVIRTLEGWVTLFVIGVVLTGLAFALLFRLLPRIGATNASTVTFVAPVSAVGLGVLVLNEPILPVHIVGLAFILAGLVLIDGRLLRRWISGRLRENQPKG